MSEEPEDAAEADAGGDENGDPPPGSDAEEREDGAEDTDPAESEEGTDHTLGLDEEGLTARLDEAGEALEAAETETDLDEVAETLDAVEAALEETDLPEPDDEDEEDPTERIEGRLSELRDRLEEKRGPYPEDVTAVLGAAEGTLTDSEWTEDGAATATGTVETLFEAVNEALGTDLAPDAADPEAAAGSVVEVRDAVGGRELDPDEDAETVGALLEAAEAVETGLEEAEVWSDLTVREQLEAEGFYDVLDPENRTDYPPEWNAVKIHERAGNVEPILLALEKLESEFMQENIFDAIEHIAPEAGAAFDAIHERAQKRNKQCIRILGRMGDERARETLEDFLGGGDVKLELVTLRALGSIGSPESTQAVADRLVADNAEVRSAAARALGLIGDTRAIDPLADVLAEDGADEVRASAAWALNRIGTERALEVAAGYADDPSYIVQAEAEKAASV